jgi:hypothetical protein
MKRAILKNMEVLFLAGLMLAAGANFAYAITYPDGPAAEVQVDGTIHTVVVSAKRLH